MGSLKINMVSVFARCFHILQIGELFSLYVIVSCQNMVGAYTKWSLDRIFAFLCGEEGSRTAGGSCRRPHHRCRRGHHRGGRTRPTYPPRARVGARPPATSTAGAWSAAARTRRPAPPTTQRARVGVPAVATVAPVRLHVTCTDRGARRPALPASAPPVARDMAWSKTPPPPPAPTRRQR